jgi:hypothetical protein
MPTGRSPTKHERLTASAEQGQHLTGRTAQDIVIVEKRDKRGIGHVRKDGEGGKGNSGDGEIAGRWGRHGKPRLSLTGDIYVTY